MLDCEKMTTTVQNKVKTKTETLIITRKIIVLLYHEAGCIAGWSARNQLEKLEQELFVAHKH